MSLKIVLESSNISCGLSKRGHSVKKQKRVMIVNETTLHQASNDIEVESNFKKKNDIAILCFCFIKWTMSFTI